MNNIIIVIVVIFLSCKDKMASTKKATHDIEISEIKTEIDTTPKIVSTKEIENNSSKPTSEEIHSNYISAVLYKGTLNETINISLYLKEEENSCGGNLTYFIGMYKYDNQDKWILLDITTDRENKNFCMVEDGFSGVLFLKKKEDTFTGNWISPDTKKLFIVALENQLLDTKYAKDYEAIEQLDEILFDDLIYNKNDC